MKKILIVDDEEKLRNLLSRIITYEGFEVYQAGDCRTALKIMAENDIDVVLCDVRLPDGDGVEFTGELKGKYPLSEIILLTAYGNIPDSVKAIKSGAFDYITKGDDNSRIVPLIHRAVEKSELSRRVLHLEKQLENKYSFDNIIGKSELIKEAVELAKKVASSNTSVLLTGETGTGKEVFAQAIHHASSRRHRNFVAINCSAISHDLLEKDALVSFETYLAKQKKNITEAGEKELTEKLSESFLQLKNNPENKSALQETKSYLFEILELNLNAIDRKSSFASLTADKSILLISILSVFCFLISLVLFIVLPGNISNPIKELTKSIRQIADNDYSQRVSFESHSEFGELAISFNTMAQKLEEYNKSNISKLLAERKITETLLNKIQYPIIGFDKNMKITLINEEFLKIAGLEGQKLIGENMLELANKNELTGKLIIIEPEKGNRFSFDNANSRIQFQIKGKDIFYEKEIQNISYTTQYEKDEHIMGYVIILKNITKFMELDRAKTNFVATISHELKTPISAIKFSLQLLENEQTGTLNGEQRELIKSCEEDTNNLLKLVAEILNFTQVETGQIQLNMMPSDIKEIIRYAINTTGQVADQRNISIIEDYPSELSEVFIDKEKTAWVLTNLISNAIRYSYDNSRIRISGLQTGNRVKISVTDTGHGIDPRYKNKIFDRYFRVPGTGKEGTGLGLAISKEFIEAQGGQITVESQPGSGSTFSVVVNCV